MTDKTRASAAFTCGFQGFENDSLWFPPFAHAGSRIDDEALAAASAAKARVGAMIEIGCAMAAKQSPELSFELDCLSKAKLDLDFFEFGANAPALGWFRLSAIAPGATAQALAACEGALAASRSPLMAAAASGELLEFGSGRSEKAPSTFLASALGATSKISEAFAQADMPLAPADFFELASADGSKRLLACAASCANPADLLADMKTFAKLAQASIEASRSPGLGPEAAPFFHAMQSALGGGADAGMPQRLPIHAPTGAFAPRPSHAKAILLSGLPSEGFEACAQAFLQAVAKRFGSLAASGRSPTLFAAPVEPSEAPRPLEIGHLQWAAMSPLLAKLPPAAPKAAPSAPKPSAPGA